MAGPRRRHQPGAFPVGSWHRLGEAVGGGADATINGQTLATTVALVPGQLQADSTFGGQTLQVLVTLVPGQLQADSEPSGGAAFRVRGTALFAAQREEETPAEETTPSQETPVSQASRAAVFQGARRSGESARRLRDIGLVVEQPAEVARQPDVVLVQVQRTLLRLTQLAEQRDDDEEAVALLFLLTD